MDKGIFYGAGVGPGDPELMTLKAVRLIRENEIIALPSEDPESSTAYKIAVQAVPELREKTLIGLPMPMKRDIESLNESHIANARKVEEHLDKGENVVFLTLGDPGIYSTFSYLRESVMKDGYEVETVSGVTSFSAVASRLNMSIADWDETVRIIPAGQRNDFDPALDDTCIFMKPRGNMAELRKKLKESKSDIRAVINCGMDNEKICSSPEEIPDDAGYFTIVIAK